ncbi:hypothetical protein Y032_0017g3279 [Ancylostoma ceylanicum]|uniref:Uncharacterized protein n=1 Tax=Ancylostoma ceylanicum TaxID=53326 RepID=A0A016V3Q5_9BILA|nr:hypothetical protein Y032_0017g3279 [Ancylostoma ceylanicum]
MNDLAPGLGKRKRAAWGAYKSIEDAHLFNTTVLLAPTYALETWALREKDENAVSVIERSIKKVMLRLTRLEEPAFLENNSKRCIDNPGLAN